MPTGPTRLLLLNTQIKFSAKLKRTLEETGRYEVTPFAFADAALKHAQEHTVDAALIDLRLPNAHLPSLIRKLRTLWPEVAIIISPHGPDAQALMQRMDLQGVIDIPISARQAIPLIKEAIAAVRDHSPDTSTTTFSTDEGYTSTEFSADPPPKTGRDVSDTLREFASLDEVLSGAGSIAEDGTGTLDVNMSDLESPETVRPTTLPSTQRPAPPRPSSVPGTRADLAARQEAESEATGRSVFELLAANEPPPPDLHAGGTLHDLYDSLLETGMRKVVEVLHQETAAFTPVDVMPDEELIQDEIPILARRVLRDSQDKSQPIAVLQAVISGATLAPGTDEIDLERSSLMAPLADAPPLTSATDAAQLALKLTQASMELAAEAAILSQGPQVVAAAGDMPSADIDALKALIDGDWAADPGQDRLRFINLPSSGRDYMLFSRHTSSDEHTEGDYTLTLIFVGNTPLRVIRRQCDRLVSALEESEAGAPYEDEGLPTQPRISDEELKGLTLLWLLHSALPGLEPPVTQALVANLDMYISAQGWPLHNLRVADDYIYIRADLPTSQPPHLAIRSLQEAAARIIRDEDPRITQEQLWADAYLVLTPSRELDPDEIQRFVHFGR